jgi:hypothetical protein
MYVDFNEMVEPDLVLLSWQNTKSDSSGQTVHLREGLEVSIYMDDLDAAGKPDKLIATGIVERNPGGNWADHVMWCCRILPPGIRHESESR